jgi:tripartite-type tricarboxylate transporter receptor subunit TctC
MTASTRQTSALRATFATALLAATSLWTAAAIAQPYPSKPIRLIVPYPPGGGTDIFARIVGARLGEALGQQIVVEQRPGAAGVIGAEAAAKAAPDGYTLVIGQASNLAINPNLMSRLPYDPVRDFAPITLIAASPSLLVVHPSLPVHSVKDLVALAKSRPGSINYASAGNGSPGHLAAEYFKTVARINLVHIPYKGATPALTDVIAGQVSLYFTSPVAAQPYVQSGRLRQIAVTSGQRFPPLPDVPTIAEAGYNEVDLTSWWGLLAPAGVARDIVARLHAETLKVLGTAEMKERLAGQGAIIVTDTPEQFATYIKTEIANWSRIVKASGARLD